MLSLIVVDSQKRPKNNAPRLEKKKKSKSEKMSRKVLLYLSFCAILLTSTEADTFDVLPDVDFDGRRNVTFQNGSSYAGDWRNGLMDGEGVLMMANGDIYR